MTWFVEWDDDGYPLEESLDELAAHPLDFKAAARFVVDVLGEGGRYSAARVHDGKDGFTGAPIKFVSFSTGGWSGNEALIGTVISRPDIGHFLQQWNAGGHYLFQVPLAMLNEERKDQ